jgi:hypothetical protein
VGAWIVHAENADTWRLRRVVFGKGWFGVKRGARLEGRTVSAAGAGFHAQTEAVYLGCASPGGLRGGGRTISRVLVICAS